MAAVHRARVEELPSIAGATPVEPEREFVEVVFKVLVAYRSLMSSQKPALQQRCDSVYARHTSGIRFMQIRPMPGPSSAAAITIKNLRSVCRPALPPPSHLNTFVHLDLTRQTVSARPDQRSMQLVEPSPGGLAPFFGVETQ